MKLLRLIRFNKHVAVFSITLKNSARHLASFSVIFLILFIAFLHFGILIFGAGFERYSSFLKASFFPNRVDSGSSESKANPSVRAHQQNVRTGFLGHDSAEYYHFGDELLHRHTERRTCRNKEHCKGKPTLRPKRGRMQLEENKATPSIL